MRDMNNIVMIVILIVLIFGSINLVVRALTSARNRYWQTKLDQQNWDLFAAGEIDEDELKRRLLS